ncbi:hypothetical protein AOX55_00004950 (plasmid) [Sinorhizobium fredii CCBAU 25509]|nr:hypothetical protein AOX55_00004950 [Sinorhizobium fredii CCBAU 25509]
MTAGHFYADVLGFDLSIAFERLSNAMSDVEPHPSWDES